MVVVLWPQDIRHWPTKLWKETDTKNSNYMIKLIRWLKIWSRETKAQHNWVEINEKSRGLLFLRSRVGYLFRSELIFVARTPNERMLEGTWAHLICRRSRLIFVCRSSTTLSMVKSKPFTKFTGREKKSLKNKRIYFFECVVVVDVAAFFWLLQLTRLDLMCFLFCFLFYFISTSMVVAFGVCNL